MTPSRLPALVVNTSRLTAVTLSGVVRHALSRGVTAFETSAQQWTPLVEELGKNAQAVSVLAKVGYAEAGLDAVEAEARQLVAEDSVSLSVLLEEPQRESDAVVFAALERLSRLVPAVGVASSDPAWVGDRADTLADLGVSKVVVPAWRRTEVAALSKKKARFFNVIGARPLLHFGGGDDQRMTLLREDPSVSGVDRAAARADYVRASEAALDRFSSAAKEDVDDDTRVGAEWIVQLIADLNAAIPQFPSGADFDRELVGQIGPMIHEKFDGLDDLTADLLFDFLTKLALVVKCTAHDRALAIADLSEDQGSSSGGDRLAAWALTQLSRRSDLAAVSLDAESPADVDLAVDLLQPPPAS